MTSTDDWATPDVVRHLIAFGYKLTEAIDNDSASSLKVSETEVGIRQDNIFPLLEARVGDLIDLSMFDEKARMRLSTALRERAGIDQNEHQYNVDHNGLCTLLALTFSAIGYVNSKYR
ncbi:MAG: hypothetical protein ACR2OU_16685 [Thermomicrobiales bacterium]